MSKSWFSPKVEKRSSPIEGRGRVTGDDWRLPELQRRYRGYFSSYLAARIAGAARPAD